MGGEGRGTGDAGNAKDHPQDRVCPRARWRSAREARPPGTPRARRNGRKRTAVHQLAPRERSQPHVSLGDRARGRPRHLQRHRTHARDERDLHARAAPRPGCALWPAGARACRADRSLFPAHGAVPGAHWPALPAGTLHESGVHVRAHRRARDAGGSARQRTDSAMTWVRWPGPMAPDPRTRWTPALLLGLGALCLGLSPSLPGKWLFFVVTAVCLAISASYELFEWAAAVTLRSGADAFLATQGDPWDTQWDMLTALIGAVTAQLSLARVHDRQLRG